MENTPVTMPPSPPSAVKPSDNTPLPDSTGRRILMFPLTRIILAFLLVAIAAGIGQGIPTLLRRGLSLPDSDLLRLISQIFAATAALAAYAFFVRKIERRTPTELRTAGMPKELGAGLALGAGIMTAVIGVIWMAGGYKVVGTNPVSILIPIIGISIISGIVEEILFRAIVFRITEESMGTVFALVLSSALFGFLHAANPGAT